MDHLKFIAQGLQMVLTIRQLIMIRTFRKWFMTKYPKHLQQFHCLDFTIIPQEKKRVIPQLMYCEP